MYKRFIMGFLSIACVTAAVEQPEIVKASDSAPLSEVQLKGSNNKGKWIESSLLGLDVVYLSVQDYGKSNWGRAKWKDAQFMTNSGISVSLKELEPEVVSQNGKVSLNFSENDLIVDGGCVLKVMLGRQFEFFKSTVTADGAGLIDSGISFEVANTQPSLLKAPVVKPRPDSFLTGSSILKGGAKGQKLTADVSGLDAVYLYITDGGNGNSSDHGVWAEPVLTDAAGAEVDATTLKVTKLYSQWNSVFVNKDHRGGSLTIGKKTTYKRGFWTHATGLYKLELGGKYSSFKTTVGLAKSAGRAGQAQFEIHKSMPKIHLSQQGKSVKRSRIALPYPEVFNTQSLKDRFRSLERAIQDTETSFGDRYDGDAYAKELLQIKSIDNSAEQLKVLSAFQRKVLLANPALDFNELLLVRRSGGRSSAGAPGLIGGNYNSRANSGRRVGGHSIIKLKNFLTNPSEEILYKPDTPRSISDIDLDFDAKRLMFSSINKNETFRLFEMNIDGTGYRQLTSDSDGKDVDHFDSCYLPDGDVIFTSTATFNGMPCINGNPRMSSLFKLFRDSGKVRQISFDQDSSWYPTVKNDGRVMYTRWEYTDMVHSNNRVLMSMNQDGTAQKSYMFSNSYFPASFFHARPIPGDPSKVVGIATGHHGLSRTGRMLLVDPKLGTNEADGVVQELPGFGKKVEADARDRLIDGVWPQITHPYPIAESGTNHGGGKYFIVAMKPTPVSLWGVYLIDVYDNMTLIYEQEGAAFLEPIPLKPQFRPRAMPDMVWENSKVATVFIQDIYHGPGLKDVPKGTVKEIQVCSYEFSPSATRSTASRAGSGGIPGTLGMDGPWDIKRILGTVPVYEDGSVHFEIPAATPVFLLPLDENGQALQIMRTWFVGLPGERVSCVGCHEDSNSAPRPTRTIAGSKPPVKIKPWQGNFRNFGYATEIQPIVDKNCMGCHDGQPANGRYTTTRHDFLNKPIPYLGAELIDDFSFRVKGSLSAGRGGGRFSKGYVELFGLARNPGIESDMAVLTPKEFSADTTELVQMLKKGHHGVSLDQDEWKKIYNWIDLNTPFHGNRRDIVVGVPGNVETAVVGVMKRANEIAKKYGHVVEPYRSAEPTKVRTDIKPVMPDVKSVALQREKGVKPFNLQVRDEVKAPVIVDLGDGQSIKLVYVPAGSFTMGSAGGALDELPMHTQTLSSGFWMAESEITNGQMRTFDPEHSSRFEDRHFMQFGRRCFDVNGDELPAVRLSWTQANEFCRWLSEKTGKKVRLPSEIQWEWACRAGSETPFSYGSFGTNFAGYANLADKNIELYAEDTSGRQYKYLEVTPLPDPNRYEAYVPRVNEVNDGSFLAVAPKQYAPNKWGLYDMHGNVAEWTRSAYRPYPLGSSGITAVGKMVVRGGSWRDRPHRATSSYRLAYPSFQKVFNVGFRIVIEE